MEISILGSGSGGNSTFINIDGIKILVDAGFSGKKLEEKLNNIGESLENIQGILITHEHTDHIQGAGIVSYSSLYYKRKFFRRSKKNLEKSLKKT